MDYQKTFPVFNSTPVCYHLESPIVSGNRLVWVEIHCTPEPRSAGALKWIPLPESGFSETGLPADIQTILFSEPVCAVLPMNHPSHVLVGLERRFVVVDLDASTDRGPAIVSAYGDIVDDNPAVRLNDCRAGYDGQVYAGTMAYDCATPCAKWGRVEKDGSFTTLISDRIISNGFGWSQELRQGQSTIRRLIYVDSLSGGVGEKDNAAEGVLASSEVWRYDQDMITGELSNQTVLLNLSAHVERHLDFLPVVADGGCSALTLDGRSCQVVTLFNGAGARVVDMETGDIILSIDVPAFLITSACWVGDCLVFITTRENLQSVDRLSLSPEFQEMYDQSGNLFWCRPRGLKPPAPFTVNV
jgi:sugar lactone lactonase YvrE